MHTLYASLLLIGLPFAIVTGPALPDTLVSLLAIYFLFLSRKPAMWHYYRHPLVKIILLFWAYCIVRSLVSNNPIFSLEASLFYGRFIFFSLAVAYLLNQRKQIFVYFSCSLLACLVIVTLDAYLQYTTGENTIGWKKDAYRVSGFFGDEFVLGSFLSRLMPLVFFILASIPRLQSWMMFLGLFFLMAVDILIYLAGERVAFFYLTLGTLLIIVLIKRFRKMRLYTFLISSLIIIMLTILLPQVKSRMIDNTINEITGKIHNLSGKIKSFNVFSPAHEDHFINALNMFYDNPLFGQGPKLFRVMCAKPEFQPAAPFDRANAGCSTHPHNTYIQLLAELGVLGTLPVIILFIYLTYLLGRQFFSLYFKKNGYLLSDAKICLLIAMFLSLWPLAPTGNFFGNWNNVIYYLPVGLYIYRTSK